jgi:predicted nucleotidyltransferase
MIDLNPMHLKIVKDILQRNIPNHKVLAFGSRVTGKARQYSDLDICIIGANPLTLKELINLKEAFSESDLPIRVDIIDWSTTSEAFRQIIKEQSEPITL